MHHFLLRDATPQYIVCLSVCPSMTFRHFDHIGWNSLKIISRPNSLSPMRGLNPTWEPGAMGTPQN